MVQADCTRLYSLYKKTLMMKILYNDIIDDEIYLYGKYLCNLSV